MTFKNVTDLSTGQTTEVPFSAEELAEFEHYRNVEAPIIAQESLRRKRNALLAETDYLALADVTLTDEMRTYRQALRDLPANTADPANPVWPVKPGSEVAAEEPAAEEPAAEEPAAEEPAAE